MENVNPPDLLKHLDKESEALTQAHQSIMSELTKLQVEEDMLMRTFYNILSAQGLMKTRRDTVDNSGMYQYQVHEEYALRECEQAHQSEMSGALIIVPEEAGSTVVEGSQIGTNCNQTPF